MKNRAVPLLAVWALASCQESTQPLSLESSPSLAALGEVENADSTQTWDYLGLLEAPRIVSLSTPLARFADDFEMNLSQWVGRSGGTHHGSIVEDPLRPGNHVLTFTSLTVAGDMFGSEVTVPQDGTLILSFEYLGAPNGGMPDDLGGAIGFAEETPARHRWLGGTIFCCGIENDLLIDDGQWHEYAIEFDVFATGQPNQVYSFDAAPPSNNTIRVMLEDFPGSGGVPGDAFFDNILLRTPTISVSIDIKPGSDPNSINCRRQGGVITVAILGSDDLDVSTIDHTTVTFHGASETHIDRKAQTARRHEGDVNADGNTDLVLHFLFGDTDLTCAATVGTIRGETYGGQAIEGEDAVRMVDRGSPT